MDARELGERVSRARELSGSSQASLAEKIGLDRSAISRIEHGEKKISVTELLAIAETLGRPLSFFVAPAVPSVVSRRSNPNDTHESSTQLDEELRAFASDVKEMLDGAVLSGVNRNDISIGRCSTHDEAEQSASQVRTRAGIAAADPIPSLGSFCERIGLVTFAAALSDTGPDGACVEVGEDGNQLGVAVINGNAMSGRRRMTLAHELGHWLTGDAYDYQAPADSEQFLLSFAIHLLAPRAGVKRVWDGNPSWTVRERAIAVCSEFRVSWSAGLGQLRNLDMITPSDFRTLKSRLPRPGEFARLRLLKFDEPTAPWLSPDLVANVLEAYTDERLTPERTVELLRGTLQRDDLPPTNGWTLESLRDSFVSKMS